MPDWRSDPRWRLYHFVPEFWSGPPAKPTPEAERSADGYWASMTHTTEKGEIVEVASWLIVGPSVAEQKALSRQADRRTK